MQKIAYLSLAGIGDYLMQTPAIRILREEKKYKIDLITMSRAIEDLGIYSGLFDNVYRFDLTKKPLKEFIRLIKYGFNEKYDISILGFPAYRKEYHITQFLLGARKRLYHRFKTGGFIKEFHFLGTDYVYFDEGKHNVENNILLLTKLGLKIDLSSIDKKYVLEVPDEFIKYGKQIINKFNVTGKLIGIHPGSTNSPAALLRRWGWRNYVNLILELVNNGDTVLIFGSQEEKEDIIRMKEKLRNVKRVYFIEENFLNSIGILSQVDLLVTNDNGFGHIGAGLGIKVLSLWGTTFDKWSSPIGENVRVLKKTKIESWYRYEMKQKVPKGFEDKGGMSEIKVEDVLDEIEKFIKKLDN